MKSVTESSIEGLEHDDSYHSDKNGEEQETKRDEIQPLKNEEGCEERKDHKESSQPYTEYNDQEKAEQSNVDISQDIIEIDESSANHECSRHSFLQKVTKKEEERKSRIKSDLKIGTNDEGDKYFQLSVLSIKDKINKLSNNLKKYDLQI